MWDSWFHFLLIKVVINNLSKVINNLINVVPTFQPSSVSASLYQGPQTLPFQSTTPQLYR